MDVSTSSHSANTNNNADQETDPELTPLEQEVLDEYAKLAGNLDNVHLPYPASHSPSSPTHIQSLTNHPLQLSGILADLASKPSAEILDALRGLERSTTTVFTLLKASVYSIVLQQEIFGDEGEGGTPGMVGG